MNEQFIRERITQLREKKGISERKLSLDLGHSTSYIRSITSGKALPSMGEFLYLCEVLGVTPMEFFNDRQQTTPVQQEVIQRVYGMNDEDAAFLLGFIKRTQHDEE